ncbi:MAG: quinolinate synthase NadA [Deltaproteobacteria bacterium]|nr:quinolinate synthase NadA [Candidatus Anaeroferrophillacea bacterium]
MHDDAAAIINRIQQLKREHRAIILAHNYEPPEIQDLADITGDSLGLSVQAAATDAGVIVFCGVSFMAESAAILAPEKRVILPRQECGCGLADTATAAQVREARRRHPDAVVITYVNSSAAVKAESDICCTSGNAVNVIKRVPADREILFVPDRNLGAWVQQQTGRRLILWNGCCPVHDAIRADDVRAARARHPEAAVIVHPECRPEVTALADAVCSTGGMLAAVDRLPPREFIIGTEEGMLHPLRRAAPDRIFHPLKMNGMICADMKKISLVDVLRALEKQEPVVSVDQDTAVRARSALERMLDVPRN